MNASVLKLMSELNSGVNTYNFDRPAVEELNRLENLMYKLLKKEIMIKSDFCC